MAFQHHPVCFLLSVDETAEGFYQRLIEHVDCEIEPPVSRQDLYLDSFDWRLHQKGLLLLKTDEKLELRRQKSGRLKHNAVVANTPRWPTDVVEGELRDVLGNILQMRALMPMVSVYTESSLLQVRDRVGKTVLRIRVELAESRIPDKRGGFSLHPRVCLLPMKGYGKEMHRVERILLEHLQLTKADNVISMHEALHAIGRKAGDYDSRMDFQLSPDTGAGDALRVIHLALLDNLCSNIEGTRADIDTEFLHDLRVATRRMRSALTQVKKILPVDVLEDFMARFAWVGQITGPTRDMDVFQLEFDGYRKLLPDRMGELLGPLQEFFTEHHRSEQLKLKRQLNSVAFRRLIKDWRAFLLADTESGEGMENADRSILDVSRERIWKMYRRVINEGRAIDYDSPAEAMHELRKSCKKLRYLIEFFRSLYPDSEIGGQIKELKALLSNLGDYQDYEVQADKLLDIGEQMKKEDKVAADSMMAMGALVAALLERQEQAHRAFSACFDRFDTEDNHRINREMFKPKINKIKSSKA